MKKWFRLGFVGFLSITMALVPIQNALADAAIPYYLGINHYGGGCDPAPSTTISGSATSIPLEKEIAQLLGVGFNVNNFSGMSASVTKYDLGGVYPIGQGTGGFTKAAVGTINSSLTTDLIVATDDEGGQITRFDPGAPSAQTIGSSSDAAAKADGASTAQKSAAYGANVNLAPVLDVGSNAYNTTPGYSTRAFSNSASVVTDKAGAYANGITSQNMGVVFKHFPGLGATPSGSANTDLSKVVITKSLAQLEQSDLVPYQKLDSTKNSMIMLGNMAVSAWGSSTPVSQNPKAISYITSTIGFSGPIMTDDLAGLQKTWGIDNATAVTAALNAGATMPLITYTSDSQIDSIIAAVKSGVSQAKIDAAYQRIVSYKKSLGLDVSKAGLTDASTSSTPGTIAGGVFMVGDSITVRAIQEGSIQKDFKAAGASSFFATGISGSTLVTNSAKNPEYNTDSPTKPVSNSSSQTQDMLIDKYKDKIASSNTVIVASGTNGIPNVAAIKETIKKINSYNSSAKIYWVDAATTAGSVVSQVAKADQYIYANSQALGYSITSWAKVLDAARDPSQGNSVWTDTNNYLSSDGTHPSVPSGIQKWAQTVVDGSKTTSSTASGGNTGICCDTEASTTVVLSGKDNVEKVLSFFMQKGLNLAEAAGFVGNMAQESGSGLPGAKTADDITVNSNILQNHGPGSVPANWKPDGVFGIGLVQWTSIDRQQGLYQKAQTENKSVTDMGVQLDFAWQELSGSYKSTISKLQGITDPVKAAVIIHDNYESSGDSPSAVVNIRGGNAKMIYDHYKDGGSLTGTTPVGDQSYAPSTGSCGGVTDPGSVAALQSLVVQYAWPDTSKDGPSRPRNNSQEQPAYKAAIKVAESEGRFVGASHGIDCGGFVTTLIYDSGWDKGYNHNAKVSDGAGATPTQEAWAKAHWQTVTPTDVANLQPGDVGFKPGHTWVFVGKIAGFKGTFAEASMDDFWPQAAPNAWTDYQGVASYYRKG